MKQILVAALLLSSAACGPSPTSPLRPALEPVTVTSTLASPVIASLPAPIPTALVGPIATTSPNPLPVGFVADTPGDLGLALFDLAGNSLGKWRTPGLVAAGPGYAQVAGGFQGGSALPPLVYFAFKNEIGRAHV